MTELHNVHIAGRPTSSQRETFLWCFEQKETQTQRWTEFWLEMKIGTMSKPNIKCLDETKTQC